jgi:hypothetical protein
MEDTRKPGRRQQKVMAGTESRLPATRTEAERLAERASTTKPLSKRTTTRHPPVQPADGLIREEWIRVAAYYRAERRGFAPGHDLEDWFAAEAGLGAREASARVPRGRKTDVRADR